jgi:hypothetical protein
MGGRGSGVLRSLSAQSDGLICVFMGSTQQQAFQSRLNTARRQKLA